MSDRSKSVAVAPLARPQHAAHHTSRPPQSKDGRVGQCRVCACRTYGRGAPPRAQTAHPRSPAVPATRPRAAAGPPRPSSAPSLPRPERRAARFDSTLHLTPGTRRVATQAGLVSAVYNTYTGYVFGQTNVRSIREVPRRTARKCGPPVDSPNRRSHTARDRPPGSTEASDEQCRASTTVVCTGGSPGSERQAGYIPVRWETESTRPHYDSVIEREYTAFHGGERFRV